ncbi:16S rRNA (cytosine(967)-C(5))-methyltransferase RsmB [Thiohalocapsa marina]|uniref:16S rRNA (cytosine(967)-C(5))-methyltransferase RsmB n=1 Tax=Thiohalocapsa marina TaxID=424902 RepID=UPI0036DB6604
MANAGKKAGASGAEVRAAAARVVHAVRVDGRSLTPALQSATRQSADGKPRAVGLDPRDDALLQALCFGTLRELRRLEAIARQLLSRPLRPADRIIEALILVGLHQLSAMRTPPHAAVSATVAAARLLQRPRLAGLVNAVLRRFQRERDQLLARAEQDAEAVWLFPSWLLNRLQTAWPAQWQAIVTASNARAPMTLRVNRLRIGRDDYGERLRQQGIESQALAHLDAALQLQQPVSTRDLPGFDDGLVSVQDASAQLAAALLDARPGERVLDACAAPGGKTAHMLERAGGKLELTAVDTDPERLQSLSQNLDRLGLSAHCLAADASRPTVDWPGAPYHRILLDAPCSATGVIRRHPDIKWLRRDSDIAALVAAQRTLLDALWPLLLPGGRLLYATCSVLPDENAEQVRAFLARHADARERPIRDDSVGAGPADTPGRQLLPQLDGGDGFYYAVLEKTTGASPS